MPANVANDERTNKAIAGVVNKGFLVVDGQKVKVDRPRVRSTDGQEQTLGQLRAVPPQRNRSTKRSGTSSCWASPTRNYGTMIRQFAAAYGIEQSAVSEHFILVSRRKVRQLLERDLSEHNFCAIYIDGIEYQGQHLIVALGVNNDGVKTVLGMRQGASENAVVVSALLGDLAQRGVDFSEPRLLRSRRSEGVGQGGP